MKIFVAYVLFPIISYLIGSISFGLLAAKLKGVDLRAHGSGNTGATNAMRVLGTKAGLAVFFLDMLKGAVPALALAMIAQSVGDLNSWKLVGVTYGAAAVFGHIFPAFHGLRGGKAVATGCGVFLVLAPLQLLTALAIWALVLAWKKYVSLASLAAAAGLFLMILVFYPSSHPNSLIAALYPVPSEMGGAEKGMMLLFSFLTAAVIFYRHRENIKRLQAGTEPKAFLSKEEIKAREVEKKYGRSKAKHLGTRRPSSSSLSALRNLSKNKEENQEESDTAETGAPVEGVEEISAEVVEPMVEDSDETDLADTDEALDQPENSLREELEQQEREDAASDDEGEEEKNL